MGQSKLGPHENMFRMFLYTRAGGGWCVHQKIHVPYPVHKRGTERRKLIEARSAAIAGLIMYPHQPDVLAEIRSRFSPEAGREYIPAFQALGRKLIKKDWWIDVKGDEVGCRVNWQFSSSEDVAQEVSALFPDQPPFRTNELADAIAKAGQIA